MRLSLCEYLVIVVHTWWARVGVIGAGVGLIVNLSGAALAPAIWWAIAGISLVAAQFSAFRRVQLERDALSTQLNPPDADQDRWPFSPGLFGGQLYPTSNYPVIQSNETGFVIRGALAF